MNQATTRHPVRRGLDRIYNFCGGLAACCLVVILAIIVLQMVARWTGRTFPGSTDYAGYAMAAASFFAMAYALIHGAHIRVNLLLSKLGRFRRWGEIWCSGQVSAPVLLLLDARFVPGPVIAMAVVVGGTAAARERDHID